MCATDCASMPLVAVPLTLIIDSYSAAPLSPPKRP